MQFQAPTAVPGAQSAEWQVVSLMHAQTELLKNGASLAELYRNGDASTASVADTGAIFGTGP